MPFKTTTAMGEQTTFHIETQKWACNICGKAENPQDYTNMDRHIIWHNNKKRKKTKEATKTEAANKPPKNTPGNHRNRHKKHTSREQHKQKYTRQARPAQKGEYTQEEHNRINIKQQNKCKTLWGEIEFAKWKPETTHGNAN